MTETMMRQWIGALFMILVSGTAASALDRPNFEASIKMQDFPAVLESQIDTLSFVPMPVQIDNCHETSRISCYFDLVDGLSVQVSGDQSDGIIDLFNIYYENSGVDADTFAILIRSIIGLADPLATALEIDAGMVKIINTVFRDQNSMSDTFETTNVVYRLVASPLQGTIFTATPKSN